MKKELGIAASLVSLCVAPALADDESASLGPMSMGIVRINIAIEGDRIEMELIAPGADIVGFEHAGDVREEDKAAVEQAEVALG